MINERISNASSSIGSMIETVEQTPFHPFAGEIFWELLNEDGSSASRGHKKNIVTKDAGILLAWLMANKTAAAFGIKYLAVGSGDPSWDPMNPPPATVTQRSLYTELARVAFTGTPTFYTNTGSSSSYPTNVVDFSFAFTSSQAVGPIVKMGLIGGDCNANAATRSPILPPNPGASYNNPPVGVDGKDILCNYVTFPVVNKGPTQTLSYTRRLTF